MNEQCEPDLFTYFQRVPHKGLARIVATLEVLGITKSRYRWTSLGSLDLPRIEYRYNNGDYVCMLGVTRQPFIGYTSWLAFFATNDRKEQSSSIRLSFNETERMWFREWSKGVFANDRIDSLIRDWFPKGEPRIKLEQDGLVNATLQHVVHVLIGLNA